MSLNMSISGLFSGIDTQALVDQLMEFERRPAYLLESKIAQTQITLSSYDALESLMGSVRGQVDQLRSVSDFRDMSAAVSHESVLSATAASGAAAGVYTLSVEQIAQSHQVVSQSFIDDEVAMGTGTFTINLGGEEVVSVELGEGGDTLRELSDAINAASSSITASVIDTGDGVQLILSSSETGADNLITVASDLSGGESLSFGSVGAVVIGSQSGSSTISSGGHFTANSDAVLSFSVSSGGVVGADEIIIDWSSDQGESGQIVIPADYSGEDVQVFGSLSLSFGAGDLQAGDNWTVSGDSSSIQSAQDAIFHFGSSGGGADPIEINSSTNSVNGAIDGVTLNLLSADPGQEVTVTVSRDVDGLVAKMQTWVGEYNNLISYMNSQFSYDDDLGQAGALLGELTAMNLDSRMRDAMTYAVDGVAASMSHLSQIGIGSMASGTLSTDGTLSVDETDLRAALAEDFDAVVSMLASTGSTSDGDIVFLHAGTNVQASGAGAPYEVRITQAASRGSLAGSSFAEPSAGSPLVIGEGNHHLKLSVDGIESKLITLAHGSYESGAELAALLQTELNADENLGSHDVNVSWVDDGGGQGHLHIESRTWGGNSAIELSEVTDGIHDGIGLTGGVTTEGTNVAGYFLVDGELEAASGSGRTLTGNENGGSTDGLSLQVNLSAEELASQGENQGQASVFSGVADRLYRVLDAALDSTTGSLETKQSGLRNRIDDYEEQVEKIDARLETRRARYLQEFAHMESLLAELNSSSSAMQSLLAGFGQSGTRIGA